MKHGRSQFHVCRCLVKGGRQSEVSNSAHNFLSSRIVPRCSGINRLYQFSVLTKWISSIPLFHFLQQLPFPSTTSMIKTLGWCPSAPKHIDLWAALLKTLGECQLPWRFRTVADWVPPWAILVQRSKAWCSKWISTLKLNIWCACVDWKLWLQIGF